jgi:putative membrane-bound dehydrogenase-like protein
MYLYLRRLLALSISLLGATSIAADELQSRLRVPEGFVIERVAADEAHVRFPMFAAFDDAGRLFVAESSGLDLYAEISAATRKCRVRLLEDRDRDGRFEISKVFADKLVFPMGLAWRAGKLYVADPPDLVAYEDQDGDGSADKRTVILSGFGHKDNGSLHGLTFGPDAWLYMTMGTPDGYKLNRRDGSVLEGTSGALIRCRPDGSDPEVLCRGFVNLVEVAFTPRGDAIGTDNWFQHPHDGYRDALVHLIAGGLYPYEPDTGTRFPVTGDLLPHVALFPAVALSGTCTYRGDGFPAAMQDNLFTAQHNSRTIGRHVLVPNGSTFKTENFEFVTTDDPDFHPSDVLEDADGSLIVVDTGSWYVQHCPTGRIRASNSLGGIYRVRAQGAAAPKDPRGQAIDWQRASADTLVTLLSDSRPAVRDRAEQTLAARGKSVVDSLAAVLRGKNSSIARQHAIWALAAIDDALALEPLREALADGDAEVLVPAARALAIRGDRVSGERLAKLLGHSSHAVRLAAAEALARSGSAGSLPALRKALADDPDAFLEHATVHAMHHLADATELQSMLADSQPPVCHRVAGEGGQVGPDLSKIGAVRSPRDLLESVVLPSATIAQGFDSYIVTAGDGRTTTGVIARQSSDVLVMRDSSGAEVRVLRGQIEGMTRAATSIMPEGLERPLSQEELRDLLAYLQSLK